MEKYLLLLKELSKLHPQKKTEVIVIFWYNGNLSQGKTLELAIDDPGLLYGATVFTTLRVCQSLDHPLTNWIGHCDRIQSTLQFFDWQQPNWNSLRQGAEMLISHFPVLRITVFPDGREWITGRFLPHNLTEKQDHGIAASIATGNQYRRSLPAYKTGNYLSAMLAKTTAEKVLAQEAILVDASGNWLETTTGNLWGWRNGSWWTPPLEAGILPGVVRAQLINWLRYNNLPVKEELWEQDLVRSFEAIAYTNSVVEVIPIHTVIQPTSKLTYNARHSGFQQLRGLFHI